ncbi:amylo-alpha-1,6-glucosidase [Planctomicrobium piriforme]|uniref:Glycogen debranching enzyme, putative n=1 Tax=Planctomicrobium piriforme TaxID=1576369 RepID=A0A1I3GXD1_9PLAN|nr:amylo-alpha-1,6-glucosidase [Planctomicrobium piriforme]SFI28134.1 glycogen debranching enzyme, putative [Planctomicrobium piriforme]
MIRTDREWLETDGLGGFASGAISGRRSRRYHALLLTATRPPIGRVVLVNGIEAQVSTPTGPVPISSQHYVPNVVQPNGDRYLKSFEIEPWPQWTFMLPDGTRLRQELFIPHGKSATVLRWSLLDAPSGLVTLAVRPLLSGRDYHSLHHENQDFSFDHVGDARDMAWHPYRGVPGIIAFTNGTYSQEPLWYRQFLYAHEEERGLDAVEDLASPGVFRFELSREPAVCILTAEGPDTLIPNHGELPDELAERLAQSERVRRVRFPTPLHRAADQYLVRRSPGQTIIAGYPWFTDWGRDTFISLRGLCLAAGRLDDAGQILRAWAGTVSQGMVPNRFPDSGDTPEYNSVDASLWFVLAVQEYLLAMEKAGAPVSKGDRQRLQGAVGQILTGYSQGTRFQIAADEDGLLRAGQPGVQLTWMDAKVDDWVVTPRIGKPVEIQALWINALAVGANFDPRWRDLLRRAMTSFPLRFWNADLGCLYDVVDVDHQPGKYDASIRPNQIFAAGGLPVCLLADEQAAQVIGIVERELMTPLGLRTLAPDDPNYHPHYTGGIRDRDGAYHQGTVWPWLTGAFVTAWLRLKGNTPDAREAARARFLQPLLDHLDDAGLGHVSEIVDGDPSEIKSGLKQIPRGCPFQAWSVGELLRLRDTILADSV